jgi:hypothetical protein
LVVLLLLDLIHLFYQLSDAELQFRQLVLGSDLSVVVGVFAHLDVEMHPLYTEHRARANQRKARGWDFKAECPDCL